MLASPPLTSYSLLYFYQVPWFSSLLSFSICIVGSTLVLFHNLIIDAPCPPDQIPPSFKQYDLYR